MKRKSTAKPLLVVATLLVLLVTAGVVLYQVKLRPFKLRAQSIKCRHNLEQVVFRMQFSCVDMLP